MILTGIRYRHKLLARQEKKAHLKGLYEERLEFYQLAPSCVGPLKLLKLIGKIR
jgi:hypothetical protein